MAQEPIELAQKLFELQKREHDGAGVPVIRDIIESLRNNDIENARIIADWKWSEIRAFENIKNLIEAELF